MSSSDGPALDDLACVHDQRLVGEVARRRDVVGDVQDGELEPGAQLIDQVEHLEADRDVEHRDRLVGEQDARLGRECPRDRHALALPA